MKIFKKIALWTAVGFILLIGLIAIPSFSTIFALLLSALIVPIDKWQNLLRKFINKVIKIIAIIVLAVLILVFFPTSDTIETNNSITSPTTLAETTAEITSISQQTTVATTSKTTATTVVNTTEATEETTTETIKETIANPTVATETKPVATTVVETKHVHSFGTATCTSPKTCSCGATEGKANGHSYSDATCTSPRTCTVCGVTSGTATGHSYSDGTCYVCGADDPDYSAEPKTTYVLNTESNKFHRLYCSKLPTKNRSDTTMSREEVVNAGYTPCGICDP